MSMGQSGLGKVVFTEEQIQSRVKEVAAQINQDYQDQNLVIIGMLKGCIYFLADLTRHLTMPVNIDFLSIGVNPAETHKNGAIQFKKALDLDLKGRHVLLVEDVIGTGLTLGYVCQHLEEAEPASIKICTLLDNPARRLLAFQIDYCCFKITEAFLVGYGLDYKDQYRNLPYITAFHKG